MKFYNREKELAILKKADALKSKKSIMTMLLGRRRVGKTTLALQNYSKQKVLYFFVSKKNEQLLCKEFAEEIIDKLDVKLIGSISRFEELFEYIIELGKTKSFTLIIDEFQEFYRINESIYSSIQKLWDLNKDETNIHLITCGSVYSLMKKIYEDNKEPLFGRCDFKIDLKPLKVSVLKEILADYNSYSKENLLDFYLLTGGVAKYIELFILNDSFDLDSMIDTIVEPNSMFLEEGKNRLIEEFGKEYGTYFSILSLISDSKTSRSEIESILEKNISGHLARLENDYNIIKSIKPINAKPNSKVQKYEIVDNFLAFWFRFIFKYQSIIEAENFDRLKDIIHRDISTFKGKFLEKLFIQQFKEKQVFTKIGSYWERNNQNEIDIVALDDIEKKLLICEVKLSEKRLSYNDLVLKSQKLIKEYKGYEVEYKLLSIKDI
ncbi:ATP-binding protein [Halarcobacter ebronensis]|uniref:ATP-binding protein n=1 Tax=Halarcobacter ebronensis TaxID=1462615 RepID=UPI003C7857C8